jgi:hypothetical protein
MGETRGGGSVVRDPWPVFREEIAVAATGRGEFVGEVPGLVGGTSPPAFFRKNVILKELLVHKVQEYHSKEVIAV